MKILFINHSIIKKCGVYDQGLRHAQAMKGIAGYDVIYREINNFQCYMDECESIRPDAIVFNYMPVLFSWVSDKINQYKCKKYGVIHEFNSFNYKFDYYVLFDTSGAGIFPDNTFRLHKPLTPFKCKKRSSIGDPIQIGTFGFAIPNKNFHRLVREVNIIFDNAVINMNVTEADVAPGLMAVVMDSCFNEITKPGISINHDDRFLAEQDVVECLNKNDINALFYDNSATGGISSSFDYLLSAQRPLLISNSGMFRNIVNNFPTYPGVSFDYMIKNYEELQNKIVSYYNEVRGLFLQETENMFRVTL